MRIVILTEGGKERGLGHIVRCSAINEAFYDIGHKPIIDIDIDNEVSYSYANFYYNKICWLKDNNDTLTIIENYDIAIIDSYLASKKFYYEISKTVKLPVFIDDNKRIDYPHGVIVNFSLCAKSMYKYKEPEITYFLGPKFIPIRNVFLTFREQINKEIPKKLFIAFGGTDIANLSYKVIRMIEKSFPNFEKITVISGVKIDNKLCTNFKNTKILLNPEAKVIAEEMATSDLAVSSAGMTLYELAYLRIPTIAIAVAKNQKEGLKEFVKRGFINKFLKSEDINLFERIKKQLDFMINNYKAVKINALVGRTIVDGLGNKRIANQIMEIYNEKSSDLRWKS